MPDRKLGIATVAATVSPFLLGPEQRFVVGVSDRVYANATQLQFRLSVDDPPWLVATKLRDEAREKALRGAGLTAEELRRLGPGFRVPAAR